MRQNPTVVYYVPPAVPGDESLAVATVHLLVVLIAD